jgi:hypothetical protein
MVLAIAIDLSQLGDIQVERHIEGFIAHVWHILVR